MHNEVYFFLFCTNIEMNLYNSFFFVFYYVNREVLLVVVTDVIVILTMILE